MPSTTVSPAVLSVQYEVPSDAVDSMQSWLGQVRADAAVAAGFLGSGIDSEPAADGQKWIASYKFASAGDIDAWVASEAYAAIQAQIPTDLGGVPVESRTVEGGSSRASEVVTAVVDPNAVGEYREMRAKLDAKASEFPGFVSVDVFEPEADATTWTAVLTFDSPDALDKWRQSPERAELVGQVKQVADDQSRVVPTGFGQWFSVNATATAQAPAWKQAMVVLAVLYANVTVLDITLGNLVGKGLSVDGSEVYSGLGLPFPVVVFIGNAVGTIILSWILMPIVTRIFAWWLDPGATRQQTIRGVILFLVIYALEMIFFTWLFNTYGF